MVFHDRSKTVTVNVDDSSNLESGNSLELKFNRKGELFRIKRNGEIVDPMSSDFELLEDNIVVQQAWLDTNIELGTPEGQLFANWSDTSEADFATIVTVPSSLTVKRVKRDLNEKELETSTTTSASKTVSSNFDLNAGQGYINGKKVSLDEYTAYHQLSDGEKLRRYGVPVPIKGTAFGDEIKLDIAISNLDPKGVVRDYKVFYDEKNGTTIRPVDANGNLLPNRKPIYQDGVWDESQISQGVGADQWDESDLEQIDKQIKDKTTEHINATNPKSIKPQWLKDYVKFGINNSKKVAMFALRNGPYTRPFFNNNFWRGTENYNKAGSGNGFDGASGQGQKLTMGTLKQFAGAEEEDHLFKKIVKYPMDMAYNMDHMFIQCYSYRAPYAKTFAGDYGKGLFNPFNFGGRESGLSIGAERFTAYKKKLGAGIKLPMPNNIQDGNGRSWNEESMTTQQMAGAQMASKNLVGSILTGDLFGTGPTIRKYALQGDMLLNQTGVVAAEKIAQLAADTGLSAEQIMQRSVGVVANSNTELLFAGVMLRSFEYQWRLSPRNRLEAANVRMIIRAFKQWSAPKKTRKADRGGKSQVGKAGGPSFLLGTPNIFRLRFVTNGNRNILGVNKFKPCALTNVDLNYTAEGQWLAYENGMPVAIDMTLRFAELEPIYDTDYSEDIAENRQYEPDDPESTGDLYPISKIDQSSPYGSDIGY